MTPARLRHVMERRWPLAAAFYRDVRDQWQARNRRFTRTPDDFLLAGDESMQSGTFEPDERKILQQAIANSDVLVDVGANVGYYSCMARRSGKNVVAIEPHRINLRLLYSNLEANGWSNAEVWPVALGGVPEVRRLYGSGTGASLVRGWAGTSEEYKSTISVVTLDLVVGGRFREQAMVVKIDAEGAEYEVLRGGQATLDRVAQTTWLVEISLFQHRRSPNENFVATFDEFFQRGYRAHTADSERRAVTREDVVRWSESGPQPHMCRNWLFAR